MPSNKKKSKKRRPEALPPPPVDAPVFTVKEFCARYRLSVPFFYKLQTENRAPRTIKLKSKVLIPRDAAEAWQREIEAAG